MSHANSSLSALPILPDSGCPEVRIVVSEQRLDLSGPVLGARYRLLHPLGENSAVTVYAAEDLQSGGRVAIRLLREPQYGAVWLRYQNEAVAASRLSHPNIVAVFDYGRDILGDGDPVAYLVMEYLEGEDLATTLLLDGPLHWTDVLVTATQICLALVALHEQGVVHCNVTPARCFRGPRFEAPDQIKLLDLGSASFTCRQTGRCAPSPRPAESLSVAPELAAGEPFDCRVDIYALGLLMYQLTTGRLPLEVPREESRGSEPTLRGIVKAPVSSLAGSAAFEAVILKAMALDPDQRFSSAREMLDALVDIDHLAQRSSWLSLDPLCWGSEATESSRHLSVREGASAERSRSEDGSDASSSRLRPALTWSALAAQTAVVLLMSTLVVRIAWSFLP